MKENTQFELYDLQVIVERIDGDCTCDMSTGDCFYVTGGKITIPDKGFCLYALHSTLLLLPAKQRFNDPSDWMETDNLISCPDPACKLVMRVNRTGRQSFEHNDVSANKL